MKKKSDSYRWKKAEINGPKFSSAPIWSSRLFIAQSKTSTSRQRFPIHHHLISAMKHPIRKISWCRHPNQQSLYHTKATINEPNQKRRIIIRFFLFLNFVIFLSIKTFSSSDENNADGTINEQDCENLRESKENLEFIWKYYFVLDAIDKFCNK